MYCYCCISFIFWCSKVLFTRNNYKESERRKSSLCLLKIKQRNNNIDSEIYSRNYFGNIWNFASPIKGVVKEAKQVFFFYFQCIWLYVIFAVANPIVCFILSVYCLKTLRYVFVRRSYAFYLSIYGLWELGRLSSLCWVYIGQQWQRIEIIIQIFILLWKYLLLFTNEGIRIKDTR